MLWGCPPGVYAGREQANPAIQSIGQANFMTFPTRDEAVDCYNRAHGVPHGIRHITRLTSKTRPIRPPVPPLAPLPYPCWWLEMKYPPTKGWIVIFRGLKIGVFSHWCVKCFVFFLH